MADKMPPVTPSPHRFLHGRRQASPSKGQNRSSGRSSGRGDGFERNSSRPAARPSGSATGPFASERGDGFPRSTSSKQVAGAAQFAQTPRFVTGRSALPSQARSETKTGPDFAQALRTSGRRTDVVEEAHEHSDDEEMLELEQEGVAPTTENVHDGLHWKQDLTHSPKRRRMDDLSSSFQAALDTPARPAMFKHPTTPASALRAGAQQYSRASSIASFAADETAHHRRPAFLRPSVAPHEHLEPLPEAFSPHRRGEKFVPGGMAGTLQQWVIEAGQAAAHSRRGQGYLQGQVYVHRVKVVSAEGHGPTLIEAMQQDDSAVRIMLVSDSKRTWRHVSVGDLIGIRAPCWEVELAGSKWVVGVDWKTLT